MKMRKNKAGERSLAICEKGDKMTFIRLRADVKVMDSTDEFFDSPLEFFKQHNEISIGGRRVEANFDLCDNSSHSVVYERGNFDRNHYTLNSADRREMEISGEFDNWDKFKRRLNDEFEFCG